MKKMINRLISARLPGIVLPGIISILFFVGCVTFPVHAETSTQDITYVEVSSPTEITDIFTEKGSMVTEQEAESDSAYATKRIILMGVDIGSDDTKLKNIFSALNASSIVSYPEYDEIILSFDTEEDTKAAYKKLVTAYGSDSCFLDQIISSEDMVFEGDESLDSDDMVFEGNDSLNSNEINEEASSDENISSIKYTATSWGVSAMGMDQLKSSYKADDSSKVTVAVLDTGVTCENTMFSGRQIRGYNVMTDSDDYSDIATSLDGHGTHVCGIITDATPSNVDLLVVGLFDSDGLSTQLALLTAFQYALEQGADVINMSSGYSSTTLTFLDSIIDTAYDAGVPIVTAAGNSYVNVSKVYPASNAKTIAVSGLKHLSNVAYELSFDSSYSNYGSLTDFSAPGTNIVSADNTAGTTYATKKGTSMAAPHITAAFAWLKLFYPEENVSELYAHLKEYSVDLGVTGRDIYYGNGCPILSSLLTDVGYSSDQDSSDTQDTSDIQDSSNTSEDSTTESKSSENTTETRKNATEAEKTTESSVSTEIKPTTEGTINQPNPSVSSSASDSSAIAEPNATKITLAKRKCLRAIRLRWKKVSGVSGYQICYSNSKTFRKGNHYITVKGSANNYRLIRRLKRHRTYYLMVRTYNMVNRQKIFSKWSNVKKVKIKK